MNWKPVTSCLGLFLIALIVIGCSKDEKSKSKELDAAFADSTLVALVNNDPIHYGDVDKAIKQFLNQLGKDTDQFQVEKPDTTLWQEALEWIISIRLLAQEAKQQGIEVDKNEIDMVINTIKGRFTTEQKFLDALEQAELSIEQFTVNLTKELMVQKLLDQQVASQVKDVTDEEALQYYNEHGDEFLQDEQIRVHHILFKVSQTAEPGKVNDVENKARRVLQRIKDGEEFDKLARQFSEDPSALKGGDIGFFSRGDMIKNFEDAAFALKPGEVSDLVRTPLGFHIIRLDDNKKSQQVPFEEVKVQIKLRLKQENSNKLFEQYVEKLKAKADIKVRGKA